MLELAHLYKPKNTWNFVQGIVKEPLGLYRVKIPSQGVKFQMWDSETRILVMNRSSDFTRAQPVIRFVQTDRPIYPRNKRSSSLSPEIDFSAQTLSFKLSHIPEPHNNLINDLFNNQTYCYHL